jgi:23S rRNA (cytidine1920-2'-O)/16S rRNA (cytidine1409-2'-O)-methyltransferase
VLTLSVRSSTPVKKRLDSLLCERQLAETLAEAKALIMSGRVYVNGAVSDKPGALVLQEVDLQIEPGRRYVSRAGEKLASVADPLGLRFDGLVVLDVGSSTGGFTDFVLRSGATRCFCVDVGTGQLDWSLRQDPRVTVMEQTDIRDAKLPGLADIAVVDVSFVSLKQVLEPTAALLRPGGLIVAMAKPQFEADRAVADRYKGVIKDEAVRSLVLSDIREWVRERFEILGEADSEVSGVRGNRERFFLLRVKK